MGLFKKLKKLLTNSATSPGATGSDAETGVAVRSPKSGSSTVGASSPLGHEGRASVAPPGVAASKRSVDDQARHTSVRSDALDDARATSGSPAKFMIPAEPAVAVASHYLHNSATSRNTDYLSEKAATSATSISSMLSGKMKNMVFVETPASIEVESDACNAGYGPPSHTALPTAPSVNSTTQGRSSNAPSATSVAAPDSPAMRNTQQAHAQQQRHIQQQQQLMQEQYQANQQQQQQQQPFRRVVRHASVPLLIDTSMQTAAGNAPSMAAPSSPSQAAAAAAAAAAATQQARKHAFNVAFPPGQAAGSAAATGMAASTNLRSPAASITTAREGGGVTFAALPASSTSMAAAATAAASAAAAASNNLLQPRRKPPRHASLKHLLHLDNYDFVTDVNVVEAQQMMEAVSSGKQEREFAAGPQNTGSDIPGQLLASGPSWRQGVVRSPSIQERHYDKAQWEASNILAVSPAVPPGMRRPIWSVSDFKLTKKLHQGYASDVYFARCRLTTELVVLKVYRLADQCDLQRVQLYREIRVHSRLQHQNIVQFYAAFLEANCVIIVQEYAANGDLLRYMYKTGGRLTERQAVSLVLQPFLSALLYLHSQGIIHRDIKPENCLLTESKQLKLADFGLAVDLNEERANTRAGTLDYMAPEVLRCPTKDTPDQFKSTPGAAHYQMGADAWAVGVFAFELVAGGSPFKAEQMVDTARNIISINIQYPAIMTDMARSFIASCLKKHPGDRPTVVEMLHHPWIAMFTRRASVISHIPAALQQLQPSNGSFGPTAAAEMQSPGAGNSPKTMQAPASPGAPARQPASAWVTSAAAGAPR